MSGDARHVRQSGTCVLLDHGPIYVAIFLRKPAHNLLSLAIRGPLLMTACPTGRLSITGDVNMMVLLATSNEEDLLTYEISDEALEAAGENETAGNYTLAACTGLSVCPS